jgi:3-dehydroquinate dehydratase-2
VKILVLHGPNLNILGKREPEIYGKTTLDQINSDIYKFAQENSIEISIYQSNHEGELVTKIQEAINIYDAIVINPAAYTHTSIAIRDAISASNIPTIEVHLTNIFSREDFRHKSLISGVVSGVISGFGANSYILGIMAAINILKR